MKKARRNALGFFVAPQKLKKGPMSDKAAAVSTVTSYTASGGTIITGTLTANEIATAVGVAVGVATFFVNWYYRHRMMRIQEANMELNRQAADASQKTDTAPGRQGTTQVR